MLLRQSRRLKRPLKMDAAENKQYIANALSIIGVLMFGGVIFLLHQHEVHPSSRDIVIVLCGVLAGIVKDVYGFWFGSSAEKKELPAK